MPNYKRYYLENHNVFITVVTYNRNPILIENIEILRACFKETMQKFHFDIIAVVVLPDHFHIILNPENIDDFPKIIGTIKRNFTRKIDEKYVDESISDSRKIRKEKGIWQRRFYDHIIRDEDDLEKHLDYIHYNPVKHDYSNSPIDWEYSSFRKYVDDEYYSENWGSQEDIKNINSLDYE